MLGVVSVYRKNEINDDEIENGSIKKAKWSLSLSNLRD